MVYKVVLADRAGKSLDNINNYLERKFGPKALQDFHELFTRTLEAIGQNPLIGNPSSLQFKIRKFVMHKRSIVFYRIRERKMLIEIIDVWDTRRNPANRKY
jgi:plasmid stabilization system protein ParE